MADPRFHAKTHSWSLKDLAAIGGAALNPGADPHKMIGDVASLDAAGADDLSFLDNVKYKESFVATRAGACVVAPQMAPLAPAGVQLLLSDTPYKSYALIARAFYPDSPPAAEVSPQAHVHPEALVGKGCVIGPGAVIEAGARLGEKTWVGANAVIGRNVEIGKGCRVGACASISHAVIGQDVRIYPGARIGQDGFGFAMDPGGFVKVPQLGRVLIGDHVEIGANSCIDRGSGPDTVIGEGTWIDNLVQIGHNVKIGKGCVLVSQVGVAGSAVLEDYVVLAGQAGVAGHLTIGKGAQLGAQSGTTRDIPAGEKHTGTPSQPVREFHRQLTVLKRLTKTQKSE